LIAILVLVLIGVAYYLFPKKLSDSKMKIKCNYMAYACGDCYPQYNVKEILEGDDQKTCKIIGTDLIVEFKDKTAEQIVDKNTAKCVICYDFVFTGNLKHSAWKGTYFVADSVNYKLRNDSCCK